MRSHVRPLQGHPQLEIICTRLSDESEDVVVEYRVYNHKRQRDGTIVRGDGFSWFGLSWATGLGMYWWIFGLSLQTRAMLLERSISIHLFSWLILFALLLIRMTRTVLHESMIALPTLGIQLETTRGISLSLPFLASSDTYRIQIPLSKSTSFIPLDQISTIVIHEGLRRWRVEYYPAVIKRSGSGISVGFSHIRPPGAVLKEVYHGLRETLYDEFDE